MFDDQVRPSAAGLEESSAMLRAETADVDALLHALADGLADVPGLAVAVTHRHGRFRRLIGDVPYVNDLHRRSDPIDRIAVRVGSAEYWVAADGGVVRCGVDPTRPGTVPAGGGIPFAVWASELVDAIVLQNEHHRETVAALRALVERGPR